MLDDIVDSEDNGVGFAEISEIFKIQDSFFFGRVSFDRVYSSYFARKRALVSIRHKYMNINLVTTYVSSR